MTATLSNSILRRMMLGKTRGLPPQVARFFLGLSFSNADHDRIQKLSEKANEGDLTPDEREQLLTYVVLTDFLAVMQSRARVAVKARSPRGTK